MKRIDFLKVLAVSPLVFSTMKVKALEILSKELSATPKMPILFLGHGSPMNAIEENEFVQGFRNSVKNIPTPRAILCISAHWETRGTFVTAMQNPRTIHDFGGFPKALFDVQYPAPGSPEVAKETQKIITKTNVSLDDKWGLDHGTWSVVKHLYPKANIPVLQLSLDYGQNPQYHYELAKELSTLRNKGILIIGSGNAVHNLVLVAWDKLNTDNFAFDWAKEANDKMRSYILADRHQELINYRSQGKAFELAIPTPEHYLPMLYILALKQHNEKISLFNDKAVGGSLSMTSFKIA
jgi:4,5-DOPA dioxygenase extradiol